jgi:hypothetical protein
MYRATGSRASRKVIRYDFNLNEAQWDTLNQELVTYMIQQSDAPLSECQLNILDKLTNSRLARLLMRHRGPVDKMFHRAAQRQWAAYAVNKFGTREINRRRPLIGARIGTRSATSAWRRGRRRP